MPRILLILALLIGFFYLVRTLQRIEKNKKKCPNCQGKGYQIEGVRAYRSDCRMCDTTGYI